MKKKFFKQWNADNKQKGLLAGVLILSLPAFMYLPVNVTAFFFLLLTLLPLIHTTLINREFRLVNPLLLISLIYGIGIPVPVLFWQYYSNSFWITKVHGDLDIALIWSYRGFLFFMIVYLVFEMYFSRQKKTQTNSPLLHNRNVLDYLVLAKWTGFISIGSIIISFILDGGIAPAFIETDITGRVSSLRQFIHHLHFFGYGFLFMYWILRLRSVRIKMLDYLFYVLLFLNGLIMIGAGAKIYFFSVLFSMLLALNFSKFEFSMKKAVIFFFIIIIIYSVFSVVTNYRVIVREAYIDESLNVIDTFLLQGSMFKEAVIMSIQELYMGRFDYTYGMSQSILDRLASVFSFTKLIEFTDGVSPYENALEVFLMPLYSILPSALFPYKPHFFGSGDFASMFGWKFGGISVTLIGSLYWAWGYIGICFGMMLVGAILAVITVKAKVFSFRGGIFQILFIILMLHLMDAGRTFQSIIIGLLRIWLLLLALYPLNLLFGRKARMRYAKHINTGQF